jgi:hypothetical protein
MDPEDQTAIRSVVERYGDGEVVVVFGAADPEGLEVAAATVTEGDPSYVGPLAGVQLGLHVLHVFEEQVKEQVDPKTYEEQVGFLAMTLDTEPIVAVLRRARGEES